MPTDHRARLSLLARRAALLLAPAIGLVAATGQHVGQEELELNLYSSRHYDTDEQLYRAAACGGTTLVKPALLVESC